MNQLEAFKAWAAHYAQAPVYDRKLRADSIEAMREILGRAQNSPPDGGSDGSFTEATWTQARDLVALLALREKLEVEIQAALQLVGGMR